MGKKFTLALSFLFLHFRILLLFNTSHENRVIFSIRILYLRVRFLEQTIRELPSISIAKSKRNIANIHKKSIAKSNQTGDKNVRLIVMSFTPFIKKPFLLARGRILGRNCDKSLKSFAPCYLQYSTNGFYLPLPPPPREKKYTETSSLRTLKIMPRNLRKVMRS
jgi:hypothetical protein